MRTSLTALAAAALVAGVATAVVAQTPAAPSPPYTKVYSYKKQAAPTNPSANANANPQQAKPFEHLPESVPYGTPAWWQEMGRKSGGSDGGG